MENDIEFVKWIRKKYPSYGIDYMKSGIGVINGTILTIKQLYLFFKEDKEKKDFTPYTKPGVKSHPND